MSVSLLPVRIGNLLERPARKPRHRAVDEVDLLRTKRMWANTLIKTLAVQVADAEQERADAIERRDIAEKAPKQAEGVIRLRDQEIADLKRRLEVRTLAEAAAAKTQELDVHAIRDNYAARVRTLPQAHCIGPVTDPGRVHGEGVA